MTARAAAPRPYRPPARDRRFDEGYDEAMFGIFCRVFVMRHSGAPDAEIVDAVWAMVDLRQQLSAENPVELLSEVAR